MSTVHKAQDLVLGRLVAIKVLHESLTSDSEFLHRFQKEAHAAANLSHPNIVTVHDIGQDGQRYYIVMEYVQGTTLKMLIRQTTSENRRPLSIDRSLNLTIQICAAIGYAHRARLVHCDVKSQNVLVTPDQRIKVADFGIARALSETSIHGQDVIWGTPQYFSPEQAAGETPTPASDVYSIGVILFELLTGRLPFEAESHTALAYKHIHQDPPRVTSFNQIVPSQIEQIVAKVLSKEPTGRYRTADQLGRVLTTYRENSLSDTGMVIPVPKVESPLSEEKTMFYQANAASSQSGKPQFGQSAEIGLDRSVTPADIYLPIDSRPEETNWKVVALAIGAILSLLGLIPLWYFVYLRYVG
jgi:serine/threonine-protein kinase